MKHRYLLALTLSALLFTACAKPARDEVAETTTAVTVATGETSVVETTMVTTEPASEKLAERAIGGGYTIYATEKNDEYTLHLADENGETDSMSITNSQFRRLEPSSYEYRPELNFYDFEVPPYFSLDAGGSLQYRTLQYHTYFAVDGKIREAEWYLDGERLESIDYTMLYCRGDGDKVVSYSANDRDYETNRYGELTKRTFTFDKENLRFDGYSEPAPAPQGAAATASETLDKFDNFWCRAYAAQIGPDVSVDNYCMITEEGFRTKDEIIGTLLEFCTPTTAEEIYTYIFESKYTAFEEIDGRMYLIDGPPSMYNSRKYVESAVEADGRITAKIYSYTTGQDVPHYIDPPLYAEFVQEDGVWKIASMPSEQVPDYDPSEKIWHFLSTYESPDIPSNYFLFDFNGDDFPEVAFVGWDEDMFYSTSYPYMNVYDLSGSEPVSLGGTSQGLSPYSDDEQCIGLYCNEKGEYFYHSLAHYILKSSEGYSYNFERFIIPVDFGSHSVEFTLDPTEQRSFDNEADAEKYKERIWKELEQLTLVTELKTSYMAEDANDEEAFREMYSGDWKINHTPVSVGNEFIDYKFLTELPSTTDIGDLADKAVQCLMESEYYTEAAASEKARKKESFAHYFDENRTLTPIFSEAYVDDFDGDGKTETFIVVDMPLDTVERNYLIFADSKENMSVIEHYCGINLEAVLDYGEFKHIVFGGYGWLGVDMHSNLFGVVDGKAVDFYSIRGKFVKENCFVSTFGHQGMGDFMYYDTVMQEYRTIVGKEIPLDVIKEMDKDNVLTDYYS